MIWAADGNTQIGVVYGPSHAGDGCETGPEFVPSRAEQIANAKLIASAPTMAARIAELEQQLADAAAERVTLWHTIGTQAEYIDALEAELITFDGDL